MTKGEAVRMVTDRRNRVVDPNEMLRWTFLRLFLLAIPEKEFERYMIEAENEMAK